MMTATTNWPKDDAERIRRALATEAVTLESAAAATRSITLAVRHSVGTMWSP
jgi:hypothetical protein